MKEGINDGNDIAVNSKGMARNRIGTRRALCVVGLCGLVGVLVDIDHIIPIFFPQYRWFNGRIGHAPLFVISSIAICYMGSRIRGLQPKLVLVGVATVTALVLWLSPWIRWGLTK